MIYSMNYKLIVAMDNLKGIGVNNKLPWPMIKEDMQMFRKLTVGDGKNAVIMGRNTYLGLPNILKERDNLVLSNEITKNIEVEARNKYIHIQSSIYPGLYIGYAIRKSKSQFLSQARPGVTHMVTTNLNSVGPWQILGAIG